MSSVCVPMEPVLPMSEMGFGPLYDLATAFSGATARRPQFEAGRGRHV